MLALDLRECGLAHEAGRAVLDFVKNNTDLKYLDLRSNNLGAQLLADLTAAVADRPTLHLRVGGAVRGFFSVILLFFFFSPNPPFRPAHTRTTTTTLGGRRANGAGGACGFLADLRQGRVTPTPGIIGRPIDVCRRCFLAYFFFLPFLDTDRA